MSLRDFKETLASLPFSQPTTEETFLQDRHRQARKPPKSSLKEQLALLELQTVALDVEFHSQITSSPSPTTSNRTETRLSPTSCSSYAEPLASKSSPESSTYSTAVSDANTSINRPIKRIKLYDHAEHSVIGKAANSGVVSFEGIQKTPSRTPRKTRLRDYAPALLRDPSISDFQKESEAADEMQGLKNTAKRQEETDSGDEEDGFLHARLSRDSEAGLFIQPQTACSPESLILWPPYDEASEVSKHDMVQVPSSINMRLMDHQREGVKFLFNLYRENKGGILGDDMGLGKTIQVIAFVSAILKIDEPNLCPEKHVLILCPTSVLRNWEQEFHSWGSFKVAIFHGIHRESVLRGLEAENLQIVLTSFDTFRIHGESLCLINWDCMVVDEAHRIKNDKSDLYKMCTKVQTQRRYGLTGTIMQNKITDLFNVFDWATPGCLGTREHFKEYYEEPLKQGQRISAPERFIRIAEERKAHLGKVLKKYLLRREKHDTIGHLMMGKEDNVIFCEMSPLQKKVYRRLLNSPDFQCLIKKDERCTCGSPLTYKECCYRIVPNGIIWPHLHKESPDGCDSCPYCLVLPCLTKLQQVSNHIELIKPNPKDDKEKQKKDQMLSQYVLAEDADLVGGVTQDESFLGLSDSKHCGKMRALEILLAHWLQQGDKVLLFSYSVRMLDILDKFMIRKGYCFSRLDGSTPMSMRQSLVDDFNRSPSKQVFLISTRAGGLGLNLVSANRVVIFDPNWNPSQDLQAQDRSFRFGQRRHVTVYRLLAAGSLEELVYTRQIYKQQLFNIAVSGNLEKRYFEGVQDSKCNQGELFGISNLFKDLTEKTFTSEIIENHEERALKFCGDKSKSDRGILTQVDYPEDHEKEASVKEKPGFENLQYEDELTRILKKAGVVYAHRNEDVVNCKLKPKNGSIESIEVGCKDSKGTDSALPSTIPTRESKCLQEYTKGTGRMRKETIKETAGLVKDTAEVRNWSIKQKQHKLVCSKEEQFASLAKFQGMDKIQFCKWLLSVSEAEKQNLLADFKRENRHHVP